MFYFTDSQLNTIHDMLEINPFVRPAYRWYHSMAADTELKTTDVEDWVIDFYNAYNKIYPNTY